MTPPARPKGSRSSCGCRSTRWRRGKTRSLADSASHGRWRPTYFLPLESWPRLPIVPRVSPEGQQVSGLSPVKTASLGAL